MKRFLACIAGLLIPAHARAVSITQYGWNCDGFLKCGSSQDAVTDITMNVIQAVFSTITALAVIAFIYGGLRMAMSQGEEGKETGKKALMYGAMGLALAAITYSGNRVIVYVIDLVRSVS